MFTQLFIGWPYIFYMYIYTLCIQRAILKLKLPTYLNIIFLIWRELEKVLNVITIKKAINQLLLVLADALELSFREYFLK